ncbi:MAG TPA: hypothetical protein VIP11_25310 [Gemmatimonadaceae bacterium]
MSFRSTTKPLLGAAALVAFGAAMVAAQGTGQPTSTRRIPISKETGGDVVPPKTDTVTVYKTDTLRLTTQLPPRVDTLRLTTTIVDTVIPPAPPIRLPSGLYAGLNAGAMAPNGSLFTPNSAGFTGGVQVGWQGAKNFLGIRGDVNYSQPGEDSRFAGPQGDPDIWNFSLDAKAQLPLFNHLFGATHRFALYGIGGYTYTRYKNLPIRVDDPSNPDAATFVAGSSDWKGFNGWNAGGGASLMFGRTEMFLETRVLAFNPDNAPMARQMPFVFGINFYQP